MIYVLCFAGDAPLVFTIGNERSWLMYIAIIAGVLAGFFQALSYLVTRAVLHDDQTTPLRLLVLSQIWMGIVSIVALPFVWVDPLAGMQSFVLLTAGVVAAYLSAQMCFFWSVQFTPSSRLAPMMGIKILCAALLAYFIRGQEQHYMQWIAVALCLLAAVAVQWSGEAIVKKSLISIIAAVLFFSISDLCISLLADALDPDATGRGIMVPVRVVLTVYSACLIPALLLIPVLNRRDPDATVWPWKGSLLYALVWFVGMFCLFTAFAYDLVFGTIMQSMRGPFAVFLGIIVAKLGMHHLEAARSRKDFMKQVLSALLMVAAISLYCLYMQ